MSPIPMLIPLMHRTAGGGTPPLPTTSLTAHFDFSDISYLYKTITASNNPAYSDPASANNDVIQGAASIFPVATSDLIALYLSTTNQSPLLKTSSMNSLNSLLFDGSNDVFTIQNRTATGTTFVAGLITQSLATIAISFKAVDISLNSATSYQNHGLIADADGFMGIYIRDDSGTFRAYGYNWDGNEDAPNATFSGETDEHYAIYRHDGTNVYISVDGGSESSAASGANSDNLNQAWLIGKGFGSTPFNVHIGEIAIYNAALTGADLTALNARFARWIP